MWIKYGALQGKAKSYSDKYPSSRTSLLARLQEAGISVAFETIERRKVLLVDCES